MKLFSWSGTSTFLLCLIIECIFKNFTSESFGECNLNFTSETLKMFVCFCSDSLCCVYVAVAWPSLCSLDPLFFLTQWDNFFGRAELSPYIVFITPKGNSWKILWRTPSLVPLWTREEINLYSDSWSVGEIDNPVSCIDMEGSITVLKYGITVT